MNLDSLRLTSSRSVALEDAIKAAAIALEWSGRTGAAAFCVKALCDLQRRRRARQTNKEADGGRQLDQ